MSAGGVIVLSPSCSKVYILLQYLCILEMIMNSDLILFQHNVISDVFQSYCFRENAFMPVSCSFIVDWVFFFIACREEKLDIQIKDLKDSLLVLSCVCLL